MKRYLTKSYKCEIFEVEIFKETEKSVYTKSGRENKMTSWRKYHETFEDAKKYLIKTAKGKIKSAMLSVEMAEAFLKNVEKQTGPK